MPNPFAEIYDGISPDDIYVIGTHKPSERVMSIQKTPPTATAAYLKDLQARASSKGLLVQTVTGVDIRAFLVELAKSEGKPTPSNLAANWHSIA